MHSLRVAKMKSQLQINLVTELVQNEKKTVIRQICTEMFSKAPRAQRISLITSVIILHIMRQNKLKS